MKKTTDPVAETKARVENLELAGAAIAEGTTPQKFLELLAARDFDRLAAALAHDAQGRLLLPYGLEEPLGRDAIVSHIKRSFGSPSKASGRSISSVPVSTKILPPRRRP